MKTKLLILLTAVVLFLTPNLSFGQAPDLGACSSFALFTAVGAFSNDGATFVTGDIGTNVGAFTGFPPGIVIGQIHVADPASVQAATDVDTVYSFLAALTCGEVISTTLGNNQILTPNIYCLGAASTLNGDLILDGQGDPTSLFIFKIDGALSTSTHAHVILTNSASLCNVYWQINGAFNLGDSSIFRGTVVANGAISLLESSSLFGRGLSRAGAISLHNNLVTIATQPIASILSSSGTITFCAGDSVTLSGNNNGTWNNGSTAFSITVTTSGDYFVTNTNGCGNAISNHIVVTVNPLPTATTGGDVTICSGSSVVLGVAPVAGHSYSWTPSSGLSSSTISNPTANPSTTTTYTLTETIDATGCQMSNAVTVTVTVIDLICDHLDVTFNGGSDGSASVTASGGTGSYTYLWSNGATTASITGLAAGSYSVTVTDGNGCQSSCSSMVGQPSCNLLVDAGTDIAKCHAGFTQLDAVASQQGATFLWTPSTGLNDPNIANPITTVKTTTTYTVTATFGNCSASAEVTVTVCPLVKAGISAIPNDLSCGIPSAHLQTSFNADWSYTWRLNNHLAPGDQHTNTYCAIYPGKYVVQVVDTICGCNHNSKPYTVTISHTKMSANSATATDGLSFTPWPNPASALLTVTINNSINGEATLRLVDLFGRIISSTDVSNEQQGAAISFDTHTLTSGVYFVQLLQDDVKSVQKVIITQ